VPPPPKIPQGRRESLVIQEPKAPRKSAGTRFCSRMVQGLTTASVQMFVSRPARPSWAPLLSGNTRLVHPADHAALQRVGSRGNIACLHLVRWGLRLLVVF
jgi:hypothetical protein